MPKKRTKKINISDQEKHDLSEEPLQRVIHSEENQHYEMHIEPAGTPARNKSQKTANKPKEKFSLNTPVPKPKSTSKIGRKIWNFLEWVAVSSLLFMILFFIMNFSSYSMLIKSKFEKLTGTFELDPYIEQIMETGGEIEQEPLPFLADSTKSAQQIPPLDLEIAPPDDRIIIPRINKNVPVVQVSAENLLKRDWNALEKDIQEALKSGVVHYPGTAQPGDRGNVVITGHSSYFPWDPGRFKDVFALLHEVIVGDQIILYHDQTKYTYEVTETKVVQPDQVTVLTQEGEDRLTLITCTPVGTNLRRLVVFAKPV